MSEREKQKQEAKIPSKQYLEATVVPILYEALRDLSKERPADPVKFVADYLLKHKDHPRSTTTSASASSTSAPVFLVPTVPPVCTSHVSVSNTADSTSTPLKISELVSSTSVSSSVTSLSAPVVSPPVAAAPVITSANLTITAMSTTSENSSETTSSSV